MSSIQQQPFSNNNRVDNHVAVANAPVSNIPRPEDIGRFTKLRTSMVGQGQKDAVLSSEPIAMESAPRYSKGLVLDVIPAKPADHNAIAQHFPNAARKMREFSNAPKPAKKNVLGNIKESLFGAKEGVVVKGERNDDGSHVRITPQDELLWRRLHLKARDKERQAAGAQRSALFIKTIKEKKHAENKIWKQRVERMRSGKDDSLKARKAHIKKISEEASARHKAAIDERVRKLAFKDKLRTMKVNKIKAGRKVEHKYLKKNYKSVEHMHD